MLPRTVRMTASEEFRLTVRRGVRAGRASVVVHGRRTGDRTRVGFVVAKSVGNAVTRNRVKRQLRHLGRGLLAQTPAGTQLVVRALPQAATSTDLASELASAWDGCVRRLARQEMP